MSMFDNTIAQITPLGVNDPVPGQLYPMRDGSYKALQSASGAVDYIYERLMRCFSVN